MKFKDLSEKQKDLRRERIREKNLVREHQKKLAMSDERYKCLNEPLYNENQKGICKSTYKINRKTVNNNVYLSK